jgi:ribose transport system permease protein
LKNNGIQIMNKMGREFGIIVALIATVAIFSAIDPMYFTMGNLVDIVDQSTINGLIALGITFVIITGGIDLSVGSIMAIVIVMVGKMLADIGIDPIIATLFGIVIGFFLGIINGFMITRLKLQPFIATLGTMSMYRGVAYIITKGWPVLNMPQSFRTMLDGDIFEVIPVAILILLAFAALSHVFLKYIRFGTYVYAVGSNEEATRLSGVDVNFNKMMTYGLCGVGAALAGMVMLARLGTGEPAAGQGYELNAIAAAAIGGTSLAGGKGTILGTLLGALLLSALKVGLVVVGVDSFWQYIATGGIIVVAAYFEVIQNKLSGVN